MFFNASEKNRSNPPPHLAAFLITLRGPAGGAFSNGGKKQKLITRALLSATGHLFDKDDFYNLAVKKGLCGHTGPLKEN